MSREWLPEFTMWGRVRWSTVVIRMLCLIAILPLSACDWAKLAVGAISTPTSTVGASTNVTVQGDCAYVASSTQGIEVINFANGKRRRLLPSAPVDRIDDLTISGNLLFALDATAPGYLTTYRIDASCGLQLASASVAVPVGPFSGVAAAVGHVIVSGGTSQLTLRAYTPYGELGKLPVTADFGRGQPDVVISADGKLALISTHIQGPRFGLTVAEVGDNPLTLREIGYVPLDAAGFTSGGFKPANFPLQAAFDSEYALIVHGGGLSIITIAPDAVPKLLATLPLPVKAVAIAFDPMRHLAYIVGANPTSEVIDVNVTLPNSPRIIARHTLPKIGSPTAIALGSHHLVVAMQTGGVHIESR